MSPSKLSTYYKAEDERNNLVIIPSGCVVPKPPKEEFNEQEQLDRLVFIDKKKLIKRKVSVILPYDKNIFNGDKFNHTWNGTH